MKTRLVLWGTDAKDERVLVAIALNARENKVDIWTFPEEVATETLYNRLLNEWRLGREIPFPNVFIQIERPLTISEPILPQDLKVERTDLVQRAQTEWHFVVLSSKLYDSYHEELTHLKEKIDNLGQYDAVVWEELKGFWEKVQSQIHDKNLFRDHARKLKDSTNDLFSKLKNLRRSFEDEFKTVSKERAAEFYEKLEQIEERIEMGLGLQPLFEELKTIQKKFRDTRLTRDDRSRVWNRLDKAFKDIKERRYGPGYKKEFTAGQRLQRRYDGLIAAIAKMEKSIDRDRKDMEFQDRRIEESEGQLEAQIRQAKLKMVEERITSKESKLAEMLKTKAELEARMAVERKNEEERKAAEEKKEATQEAKEPPADPVSETTPKTVEEVPEEQKEAAQEAKEEPVADPASETTEASGDVPEGQKEAAQEAKEEPVADPASETTEASEESPQQTKESLASAIATTVGESLTDVADTVKAVAEVVGDKISEALSEEE